MRRTHLFLLVVFLGTADIFQASKQIPLEEPFAESFNDDTERITLARDQQFSLPITTRTITHSIETIPENSKECRFEFQMLLYRSLASESLLVGEEEITDMLPLSKKEKVFLVDQNHNLLSYSLDQHFLLKRLAPKTSIVGSQKQLTNIVLAATEDEEYVYYLTPSKYLVFQTETLGVEILLQGELQGSLVDLQDAFAYKGFLIVLSRQSRLRIYKIDKTKKLTLVQSFLPAKDVLYADMEFDKTTEMLYLLAMNVPQVSVYHFEPSDFPQPNKTFKIFKEYDSINLQSVTNKHHSQKEERNVHFDLAISRGREQQTLMVLFLHNYHNVVAELFYNPVASTWKFIRYFKFSVRVNQIHIAEDVLLVVGSESMGIFPFGIHPRLIDEELNGLMALTSILRLILLRNGQFVGITRSTIEYGTVKLTEKAELVCKINQQSRLKTVRLKANLTACTNEDRNLYENYCAYEKTFLIDEMQLAVSAPMADTVWTAVLIFLAAIVLGLCILLAMRRKKQREIRKLELYFEEKRKAQPSPSDRRTIADL